MTDQTRREFFVNAGGAIAATPLVAGELLAAAETTGERASSESAGIPPHRPIPLEGIHAYTDKISVAAGETVRFQVSSSVPYELQVCRLGVEVDNPASDQVLQTFPKSPAAGQAIHPGSYLVAERPLEARTEIKALTIELWARRWRTLERQALLSQFDQPTACGFALFIEENGALSFYLGDGGAFREENLHTTPADQLKMQINPEGLKTFPDNAPSSVLSNQWHHIVATFDGTEKRVYVDGKEVGRWKHTGPVRAGAAPLRIGAAGKDGLADFLLDADIALPAIYGKALTPAEIAARTATRGLVRPNDSSLLACWPLDEERGDRAADSSGNSRHARIINSGTWMIGGPSFNPDVPRFGTYDPAKDPERGHGLRLASDDLYDCRWNVSHEFKIPDTARSGIYVGRFRFSEGGEERMYHTVFVVRRNPSRPKAPVAFLCSTNSWKAYSATPFCPSWPGLKKSIGNNGPANTPAHLPSYCFYRVHRAGQGTYQLGFKMPWPVVGPYTLMGPEEWNYSHLCRQDRFTQTWLERKGYDYDVFSDTDLQLDPHVLDGYKALVVVGHSEYWSFEAMESVSRFLDRGGNAIVLSGNTAFWRVSFNADASIIECRKGDAPGTQVRADRRGEMWHSHDGRRGGMSRECGFPAWKLFGLEYFSLMGVGVPGVGPYKVRNPDHFLFREPIALNLKEGDSFCGAGANPLPQPIGHEGDVRVSTLAKFLVDPPPTGGSQPTEDPAGISLLADGFADAKKLPFAWDYFQRPVPFGKGPGLSVAAEMIYWERPGGGKVFHSGSINSGSTLALDDKWSGLMQNVLSHFGVPVA